MHSGATIGPVASILVLALVCSASVASVGSPPEYSFPFDAACSDAIVLGAIANTEESTARIRHSYLVVERPIWGSTTQGDTLCVRWHAKHWVSDDGLHEGFVSGRPPQLDRLVGKRALYLLRNDLLQEVGAFRLASTEPVVLAHECKRTIREKISWLRRPSTRTQFAAHLEAVRSGDMRWPCDAQDITTMYERMDAVAAFLDEHLESLMREGEAETGRAN